jgi:hypothetical protein
MDVTLQTKLEERKRRVRHLAEVKFQNAPDWVTFYREVLGVDGIIYELFPLAEHRAVFKNTDEYAEIQQLLARLRERRGAAQQGDEPTRVITVRLPQSLHESLRSEAHDHCTSMNKLCISKLLQMIAEELVPSDLQRREKVVKPEPTVSQPPSPPPAVQQGQFAPVPAPQPSAFTPPRPTTAPTYASGFSPSNTTGGRPF